MLSSSRLFAILSLALPVFSQKQTSPGLQGPVLNVSHADPCIFQDTSGIWYSFADGQQIISSTTSDIRSPWKTLPAYEVQWPDGKWTHDQNLGAPQADGSYLLYFAAGPNKTASHDGKNVGNCIGYARSQSVLGPYIAAGLPVNCTSQPGSGPSAPALFQQGSKNYFLYKSGYGWDSTGVTKIFLKEVAADGVTDVSAPVQIAEHTRGEYFEIEGPQMTYNDGTYYAFYNLGVWCDKSYHIVWSSSKDVLGTYTFGGTLLQSGTTQGIQLVGPGGAGFSKGNPNTMTFMSYVDYPNPSCHDDKSAAVGSHRQFFTANLTYVNGVPMLVF